MRARYLVVAGLLGLGGCASAAPMIESGAAVQIDEISTLEYDSPALNAKPSQSFYGISEPVTEDIRCYGPDKAHFLSICNGVDSLQAHILPSKSLDKCVPLSKFVAYHVTGFIQRPDLTCKFYEDSNGCHGELVYVAKTRGSRPSYFPVEIRHGSKMKYVFCYVDGHETEVDGRADDPPPNQSPPDNAPPEHAPPVLEVKAVPQDNENDALSIRETDVIHMAEETPQLSYQSFMCGVPLEKHCLIVCSHHGHASNYIPNEWINTCVQLSTNVAHHVATLVQNTELTCVFYGDSNRCNGNIIKTFETYSQKGMSPTVAEIGVRIKYVLCRKHQSRRDVGDAEGTVDDAPPASETDVVDDNDVPPAPTDLNVSYEKAYMVVCNRGTCQGLSSEFLGDCRQLPKNIRHGVTAVTHDAGLACRYYDDDDDDGSDSINMCLHGKQVYATRTIKKKHRFDIAKYYGKGIKYVQCYKGDHFRRDVDEIEATESDASLDTTSVPLDAAGTVTTLTGKKTVIAQIWSNSGHSLLIPQDASGICVELDDTISHHVDLVSLWSRAWCRFYQDGCATWSTPLFATMTAGIEHASRPVPSDICDKITHVVCGTKSRVNARADDASLEKIPTYDTAATIATSRAPISLIARIFSGSGHSLLVREASAKSCIKLKSNMAWDITHVAMVQNVQCKFYMFGGCVWAPLYTVVTGARYTDRQIPPEIGKKISYVMCETTNFNTKIAAREEGPSSAVALDTPAASAVKYATHMYSNFIVASIEDTALGQCYKLSDEVSKHVTWIQQPRGFVCKYYRSNCQDSNALKTIDSRSTSQSYAIDAGTGNQIEYAMCKKSFNKRDIPSDDGPDAEYANALLDSGELRIGEDYNGHKYRKVINALVPCIIFPNRLFTNSTRFFAQSRYSHCTYYKKDCTEPYILHATNAEDEDWELRTEFAQQINAANCSVLKDIVLPKPPTTWQFFETPETHVETRATPTQANTDITVTNGDSISAQWTPVPLKVGDVFICSHDRAQGCWMMHVLNMCLAFPEGIAYNAKLVTQAKGTFCKYFRKPGCVNIDEDYWHVSLPTKDSELAGDGLKAWAGVWCGGTGLTAGMDDVVADDEHAIEAVPGVGAPIYNDDEITKRDLPPGSTTVCHQPHYQFCTDNRVNALQQCANFAPADQGPLSIIQYGGAYCKWYRDFGCGDDAPKSIDSRAATQWIDELGRQDSFKSVKCETYQW